MPREFNDTGTCVPDLHFMVDITQKILSILPLIESGKYFTINRPRQFGKTTTLYALSRHLENTKKYYVLKMSFEKFGQERFANTSIFLQGFVSELNRIAKNKKYSD